MPRSRRSPNRITDNSLVDDAGYQWYRVNKDLRRDAIARLLADPDVRVGVHAGRARLRWIADVERERVWSEEIEPNFHDHAGDAIATSTRRHLPFHGTLWRRRGKQLLLFDDFDWFEPAQLVDDVRLEQQLKALAEQTTRWPNDHPRSADGQHP